MDAAYPNFTFSVGICDFKSGHDAIVAATAFALMKKRGYDDAIATPLYDIMKRIVQKTDGKALPQLQPIENDPPANASEYKKPATYKRSRVAATQIIENQDQAHKQFVEDLWVVCEEARVHVLGQAATLAGNREHAHIT